MKLLSSLPVFMVFICHAENAIYGEWNEMDPAINQPEVDDSELGFKVGQVQTKNIEGKNSNFHGVSKHIYNKFKLL